MSVEPLPPELAALFADEREAPAGDEAQLARIAGRVAATVGVVSIAGTAASAHATGASVAASSGAVAGTAAAGTTLLGVGVKIAAIVIAVGAIGGGATLLYRQHASRVTTPTAPPPRAMRAAEPAPAHIDLPAPIAATAPAPATPLPIPAPVTKPKPAAAPPLAEAQPALLARAWSTLEQGDAAAVLALVERDEAEHPYGALAEERDALHVEALRRLGRTSEAGERARAFLANYPHSLHHALVQRALEESP